MKITSFKQFKEACRKNTLINGYTGKSRKVIELIYTKEAFAGKTFETNSMKTAYEMFKTDLTCQYVNNKIV